MTNVIQMMQKASQMKQRMQEMQERVQKIELTGEAGGGLVTCRVTGRFELKAVKVDPSRIKPDEAEMMDCYIHGFMSLDDGGYFNRCIDSIDNEAGSFAGMESRRYCDLVFRQSATTKQGHSRE